jgi:hypothetical protein
MAKLGFKIAPVTVTVKQGAPYTIKFEFKNADGTSRNVSAKTFAAQIRKLPSAADPAIASWTFDTTDAATGIVLATISGASTASLPVGETAKSPESQYYWDAKMSQSGVDTFIIPMSPFIVEPRITR